MVEPEERKTREDPDFVPAIAARGDISVPDGKEVRLHLRFPDVGCDLSPLAALQPNDLDHLSIDSHAVPDAELRHIAHLTGLGRLYIRDIDLTDAGLAHIGQLTSLYELDLTWIPVTDDGLVHLRGLKKLRQLTLDNTDVTQASVVAVRQWLPECDVHFSPKRPPKYPPKARRGR
jgi:hypothetical protein